MKLKLKKVDGVTYIKMDGYLDLLSADSIRNSLESYLKQDNVQGDIVFNLDGLKFIGSSGIRDFISMLEEFHKKNESNIKCKGANKEFKKLFKFSLNDKNVLDELFEEESINKLDI